jgi:hypothetical protein
MKILSKANHLEAFKAFFDMFLDQKWLTALAEDFQEVVI